MLLRTLKTAKVKVRSYGNSKNGDKQMHKFVLDLIKLKKLGAVGVKQSFEDEGASREDIKKMRDMTLAANLDLNVNFGLLDFQSLSKGFPTSYTLIVVFFFKSLNL